MGPCFAKAPLLYDNAPLWDAITQRKSAFAGHCHRRAIPFRPARPATNYLCGPAPRPRNNASPSVPTQRKNTVAALPAQCFFALSCCPFSVPAARDRLALAPLAAHFKNRMAPVFAYLITKQAFYLIQYLYISKEVYLMANSAMLRPMTTQKRKALQDVKTLQGFPFPFSLLLPKSNSSPVLLKKASGGPWRALGKEVFASGVCQTAAFMETLHRSPGCPFGWIKASSFLRRIQRDKVVQHTGARVVDLQLLCAVPVAAVRGKDDDPLDKRVQ